VWGDQEGNKEEEARSIRFVDKYCHTLLLPSCFMPPFATHANTASGHRSKRVRLYLFLGSVFLLVEIFLALWGYRVVTTTTQDSLSSSFHQYQHQQQKNNNNNNININNKQEDHSRPRRHRDRSSDGSFNGYSLYFRDLSQNSTYHSRPYSSIRCVGENYQGDELSWLYRSCHFRFLCYNVSSKEFEIYARPDDETLQSIATHRRPLMDFTSTVLLPPPPPPTATSSNDRNSSGSFGVSLASGINDDIDQRRRMKDTFHWFPTIIRSSPPERYYALDDDVVMVPFHSYKHKYSVVWDDLFPVYTLLNIFQLLSSSDEHREALMMRYAPNEAMDQYDDFNEKNMDLFRSLMMRYGYVDDQSNSRHNHNSSHTTNLAMQRNVILTSSSSSSSSSQRIKPLQSNLVCARDAVAGLGPHGIRKTKKSRLHNYGRGDIIWKFRNYCLNNLGLSSSPSSVNNDRRPKNIRVSILSDNSFNNRDSEEMTLQNKNDVANFTLLEDGLRRFLNIDNQFTSNQNNNPVNNHTSNSIRIEIESHDFSETTLTDHVRLMVDSTIFISFCSDLATVSASFLPQGATFIVFYDEKEELVATSSCPHYYRDLLNNLSHVRVHWLPMTDKKYSEQDMDVLYNLVEHEIKIHTKKNRNSN
jgi:hypothetical protein